MKILVTGAWSCTDEQLNSLSALGHEITFMKDERGELPAGATDCEAVICNGLFLYHSIELFIKLKYIQLTSAGTDRVPIEQIKQRNIALHTASGVYSIPMAEYAVLSALQLLKHSVCFAENKAKHIWQKRRDVLELYGKRVLIVGCGSVGTECARRFGAFGCTVVGIDPLPRIDGTYSAILPTDRLDAELRLCDVAVLALPLTDSTYHLIDSHRIALLKNTAILINISRGAVIDTAALTEASSAGSILGAALDVFEEEPLPASNPLWELDNLILTPHNSFVGDGNSERLYNLILDNLSSVTDN